jgi:hypothetical protein
LPHAPQFARSVCSSTQAPLHGVWPVPHDATQVPPMHDVPVEHALPQAPQFLASLASVAQVPLQLTWVPVQPPEPG